VTPRPGALPRTDAEWNRRVWRLAGPIILSNLSVPLVGAVDTAVVGHLPDPVYIGAVAIGAVIFSFLYWGFGFLRMGTTGFAANALGAGDYREVRATAWRSILLATLLGACLIAVQVPVARIALWAMESGDTLDAQARLYFEIRIWSAPATLINYALLGVLIGIQRTGSALVLQLVLNGTNVALDLLFVVVLGHGVAGVAAATVIAEYLAVGVGLWLILRAVPSATPRIRFTADVLDPARLRALVQVNTNLFIRTLCLIYAFFHFTAVGTRMGELTLAANAVLLHLQHFLAYGLDGFAHAVEALAGAARGARDRAAFRAAVRTSTRWAAIVAVGFALLYLVAGGWIVALLTGIPEVRAEAMRYLPWLLLAPLVSVWSFQLDGIFIGTMHTVEMRNAMIVSLAIFLLAVWLLVPRYGNHGLWLAFTLLMVTRAVTLGLLYPRVERGIG